MRHVKLDMQFRAHYSVLQLERIDRQCSRRVFSFPGAVEADPQQELAEGPILAVAPENGEPWIGVFRGGGYGAPPAASRRVISWPDERSICVVATAVDLRTGRLAL